MRRKHGGRSHVRASGGEERRGVKKGEEGGRIGRYGKLLSGG